jgi:hypothetical protein
MGDDQRAARDCNEPAFARAFRGHGSAGYAAATDAATQLIPQSAIAANTMLADDGWSF